MEEDKQISIEVSLHPVHGDWRDEVRKEWRENGRWSRMVGGGFVTSSKDPDDWEHPHLK